VLNSNQFKFYEGFVQRGNFLAVACLKPMSEEKELNILSHLTEKPGANQREIAADLEISLGSVNFIIKALIEKGWVKADNFYNSNEKLRYIYQLTPTGIAAKINLTRHFMLLKQREYQALKARLEQLEAQGQD